MTRRNVDRSFWVTEMPIFVALDGARTTDVSAWGLDGFNVTLGLASLNETSTYNAAVSLTADSPAIAELPVRCVAFDPITGQARLEFMMSPRQVFHDLYVVIEQALLEIQRRETHAAPPVPCMC